MLRENIEELSETVGREEKPDLVFEATLNGDPDIRVYEAPPLDQNLSQTLAQSVEPDPVPKANVALAPDPSSDLAAENGRMLARIALMLLVLILLVNVPITSWGASLLQIMPQDITPVAIAEGMVLADEQGNHYLLHNHRLRHFGSPEAYERYSRLRGRRVQPVADRIIGQYGHGLPIYHLVQCEPEGLVYALEHGQKRPFTPPADTLLPFTGAAWDQIELVDCQQLADIPEGPLP
ncbi:MAG: hypothetical protein R6X32_07985 [Chloroflexota bacterium]